VRYLHAFCDANEALRRWPTMVPVAGVIRFQAHGFRCCLICARMTRASRQLEWRQHLLLDRSRRAVI